LKKFGYTYVDTASNGLEAVSAAESKRYDLILMDLQMPLMDGHTARMKIAEREKDLNKQDTTFVVALTANADSATRQLCMEEQGFDGFLGKPLVIRELDAVFETAYMRRLDSRTPATPRTPGSPASREGEGEGGEVVV
jgi:two-component system sensor histidine kinase/response regulator